jgi:hypothetical protein
LKKYLYAHLPRQSSFFFWFDSSGAIMIQAEQLY